MQTQSGKTIIEVVLILVIIAILLAISLPALSNFRNVQALKNSAEDITSLLNEARTKTLSSYNSTYYSVHFTTTSATLFTGGTYNASATDNKVVTLDSAVNIPSSGGISLNGGGSDVKFTRLSGDTTNYGTIVVQLLSDSSKQKTITVAQTGVVSAN